jgi:hypothetical protein
MRLHVSNDTQLRIFAFGASSLAVIAASDGDLGNPKIIAGALAAGFGSVLALMRQAGTPPPSPPGA